MRSSPQPCPAKTRSWLTSTDPPAAPAGRRGPWRRALAALLLAASLSGCAELTVVDATPQPTPATLALPPIGFNHRYGNNPVSAKDGFNLERSLFASKVFWEVALRTDPVKAGYVNMADPAAITAARHAATSLLIVIATENGATITGMLAFRSDPAQAAYCEAIVDRVRAFGYDNLTSVQLLVFFTEADNHAKLTWSPGAGYKYTVYDNDLRNSGLTPMPTQTPLPAPPGP